MRHPESGTIHAWLDGELDRGEAAALEMHVAECSECAGAVAEARGFIAASSRIVSALDSVPGDVIPISGPRKIAWHRRGQLRAAAAVLVVAGASLIVLKQGPQPSSSSRVVNQAVPALDAGATKVANASEAPAAAQRPTVTGMSPSTTPGDQEQAGAAEKNLSRRDETRRATEPPPANAAPSLAASARTEVAVLDKPASLYASDVAELRHVRTDTAGTAIVTVYQVSPGVEVTLREMLAAKFVSPQREVAQGRIAGGTAMATPAPVVQATSSAHVESITWTSASTGRTFTLTGALSKEQLTAIRMRLPPSAR